MIEWSLAALAAARAIGAIVIAVPPGCEREGELAAGRAAPGAAIAVIPGGATRADSIGLALARVEDELVAIHDAARPLITAEVFDRVVGRLAADADAAAAIAAAPLADTVKRARVGRSGGEDATLVERTLDRDLLWAAQTPQAFRVDRLRAAQEAAAADGRLQEATDEASLIELNGGRVLLEETGSVNLKVTTAADLATAGALIASRP